MPKLIMKARISGTRNGKHWPEPGQTVEVSDREAQAILSNGLAVEPAYDESAQPKKSPAKNTAAKKASGSS